MIRNSYEALYIKFYKWSEKVNGRNYANNYSASLMMTLAIFIALAAIVSLLHLVAGWEFVATTLAKGTVIFLMILVAALNYKYFTKRNRYQELLKSANAEPKTKDGTIVLIVVLGLLILLFGIWLLGIGLKTP